MATPTIKKKSILCSPMCMIIGLSGSQDKLWHTLLPSSSSSITLTQMRARHWRVCVFTCLHTCSPLEGHKEEGFGLKQSSLCLRSQVSRNKRTLTWQTEGTIKDVLQRCHWDIKCCRWMGENLCRCGSCGHKNLISYDNAILHYHACNVMLVLIRWDENRISL